MVTRVISIYIPAAMVDLVGQREWQYDRRDVDDRLEVRVQLWHGNKAMATIFGGRDTGVRWVEVGAGWGWGCRGGSVCLLRVRSFCMRLRCPSCRVLASIPLSRLVELIECSRRDAHQVSWML